MPRHCLALDLIDDAALIKSYREYHKNENAWPEVTQGIKSAGIEDMEIYLCGNRLFMIIEADENFSFTKKRRLDEANQVVQDWEKLMSTFQQPLPFAKDGEKWVSMKRIYTLPS